MAKPKKPTDPNFVKFTDIIKQYWLDPDYGYLVHQSKAILKDFNITYKELRMAIKYGIEYNNDYPKEDEDWGLYQYIKYITPSLQFAERITANQSDSDLSADTTYIPKRQPYYPKEVEW